MKTRHVVALAVAFFVGLCLLAVFWPEARNPPAVEDPTRNHLRSP